MTTKRRYRCLILVQQYHEVELDAEDPAAAEDAAALAYMRGEASSYYPTSCETFITEIVNPPPTDGDQAP